jgi:O-antigen ligase
LGIVMGIGLLLQIGFRRHWYLSCCVLVIAIALLLAASVSGMAAVIVGLLVLFIARGVPLKTVVSVVLALAAVYLLVFGVIDRGSKLDPITRIEKTTNSNAGSGGGTLQLRIDTIDKAWSEILQKPIIGHGLDQQTLSVYFDKSLYVYYPPHNLIALYWYGGGIFMLVGLIIMVGSAFSRLLHGRLRAGKNWDPMRDVVLAACIAVLFFAMQGPELVDRWFWISFLLALTFRDYAPPAAPAHDAIALPVELPEPPALVGNGQPRRVRGTVGRHAAPDPEPLESDTPAAHAPSEPAALDGPKSGGRHAAPTFGSS